ncbi:4-hydroxybenzoate octaprenyltransferase [Variibacter gotjawalensis]|uniref:4-hydroxybenzoate octaprenyltransferase n=1 Tax=Variibacter gotjawalensis TaxID=1333996 RepID=A0A0S3PQ19_9BRAD|nr:4-hydroxybenzoate octaprenyltransferase [Variibacter gotjawalensis]NIK48167.1 4-hydroxybenzoate polyprenyltransferase [Variibacter gotjawalensis]RZS50039.1 4-hydroxybenzoate polyprenyltransferase [Variibacter gotjawalensis]BAT57870.1 4-hydroxybenzoate octaprenyltransferase [Variibacter gotjawalensis]
MTQASGRVADSVGNWVDTLAPDWSRPYLRLARADRPIGSWLLLLPCWWSAAIAAIAGGNAYPNLWHVIAFAMGAVVMRGAGCTWNDLVDRDLDAMVERTRSRPLPSGQTTAKRAAVFLVAQALVGFAILLTFNGFAIFLGVASLGVVAIYPFMKRFTWWPQIGLGLAFSWGALMGWACAFGRLDWPALLLYAGSIAWVIGYDTIYAHQDREDDALIGVKSTARLFAGKTAQALVGFYAAAVVLIGTAITFAGGGAAAFSGLALFAAHLGWQITRLDIDNPSLCWKLFHSNREAGLLLFAGLCLDAVLKAAS